MFRDQRGFMVPLSMIFTTFIVLYVLHLVVLLGVEQDMLKERWEGLKGEVLIQNGVNAVIKEKIKSGTSTFGDIVFKEGTVSFQVVPLTKVDFQVTLDIKQKTLAKRHVRFQYNIEQGVLSKWTE